jgi:hypothetical protein
LTTPTGGIFRAPFVVRSAVKQHRIVMLANVNTWNAYNTWGGRARYSEGTAANSDPFPWYFSFERPCVIAENFLDARARRPRDHQVRSQVWFSTWLDALARAALNPNYAYDTFSDVDLDVGISWLNQYQALLLTCHTEYWTESMRTALQSYLQAGGHVIYLSGNGIFDRVTLIADNTNPNVGTMQVIQDASSRSTSGTELFERTGEYEQSLLGLQYDDYHSGFDFQSLPNHGSTYYVVVQPTLPATPHPFLNIGTLTSPIYPTIIGDVAGLNEDQYAAGWEIDGYDAFLPQPPPPAGPVQVLATSSPVPSPTISTYASITYYRTNQPQGALNPNGWVFSAGSITFCGCVAIDPILQRIVRNALDSALAGTAP